MKPSKRNVQFWLRNHLVSATAVALLLAGCSLNSAPPDSDRERQESRQTEPASEQLPTTSRLLPLERPANRGGLCGFSLGGLNEHDFEWEDLFTDGLASHEPCDAPALEGRANPFAARISERKAVSADDWAWVDEQSEAPVVLFVAGGNIQKFLSDAPGYRALQNQLYEQGARILEVAFSCPSLHPAYEDTEDCGFNRINNVLEVLSQRGVIDQDGDGSVSTGELWWPENAYDRFAMGESSGQIQLQFAIEKFDDPWGVMNRVVYGGGGVYYSLHDRINCSDAVASDDIEACDGPLNYSCDTLNGIDLVFAPADPDSDVIQECGGCWNTVDGSGEDGGVCLDFDGNPRPSNCGPGASVGINSCNDADQPSPLRRALDAASIDQSIGPGGDDGERILGHVLQNTGYDFGINREASAGLIERREPPPLGTTKSIWNLADCVCGCPFYGHGLVERMYELFRTGIGGNRPGNPNAVADWVEFFVEGDSEFNFFTDVPNPGGIAAFTLQNPPDELACADPAKYNVGVVDCLAVQGSLPDGYLPSCSAQP